MALPNSTEIATMDWSYTGLPFVDVPANGSVNTATMDWSYAGLPFVTNPSVSGPVNIKQIFGVSGGSIGKLDGVLYANIESIIGIT